MRTIQSYYVPEYFKFAIVLNHTILQLTKYIALCASSSFLIFSQDSFNA